MIHEIMRSSQNLRADKIITTSMLSYERMTAFIEHFREMNRASLNDTYKSTLKITKRKTIQKEKKPTCCDKLLLKVSMGKYCSPLFFKQEFYYTTKFAGVISILLYLTFIGYALGVVTPVLFKTTYEIQSQINNFLPNTTYFNLNLHYILNHLNMNLTVEMDKT